MLKKRKNPVQSSHASPRHAEIWKISGAPEPRRRSYLWKSLFWYYIGFYFFIVEAPVFCFVSLSFLNFIISDWSFLRSLCNDNCIYNVLSPHSFCSRRHTKFYCMVSMCVLSLRMKFLKVLRTVVSIVLIQHLISGVIPYSALRIRNSFILIQNVHFYS